MAESGTSSGRIKVKVAQIESVAASVLPTIIPSVIPKDRNAMAHPGLGTVVMWLKDVLEVQAGQEEQSVGIALATASACVVDPDMDHQEGYIVDPSEPVENLVLRFSEVVASSKRVSMTINCSAVDYLSPLQEFLVVLTFVALFDIDCCLCHISGRGVLVPR